MLRVRLLGSIERLEELVRRYCNRRDGDGNRRKIAEDIRVQALESLLPEALEAHVQLNRVRIDDYQKLRDEVVMCTEAKTGLQMKIQKPSQPVKGPSAMDVNAFAKGGGGGGKDAGGRPKGGGGGKGAALPGR